MTFEQGDRAGITFADKPDQEFFATVLRVLSDQQEGLSLEAEDYVAFWMELELERARDGQNSMIATFAMDSQYYIDGRRVTLRKL